MESQTKIKIKKDMGTSPEEPGETPAQSDAQKTKLQQQMLQQQQQQQQQAERKAPAHGQYLPAQTPNPNPAPSSLAAALTQGTGAMMQMPANYLTKLAQLTAVAADPTYLTVLQHMRVQQALMEQVTKPAANALSTPPSRNPVKKPATQLAMHKLPTMVPTSPVGDLGKPQAKRPRVHSGGHKQQQPKQVTTGPKVAQGAGRQASGGNNVLVNGLVTYPGRPSSVPPQFPPGPFVNGFMTPVAGMVSTNQHSPPEVRSSPLATQQGPAATRVPAVQQQQQRQLQQQQQQQRQKQPPNYLKAFENFVAQNPNPPHGSPPPPGNSPPAHMHHHPPCSTSSAPNGLPQPSPAHASSANTNTTNTPSVANGYDAPLELTTKKRDSTSSDSKNNNAPSESTILKVPNLMSLKT